MWGRKRAGTSEITGDFYKVPRRRPRSLGGRGVENKTNNGLGLVSDWVVLHMFEAYITPAAAGSMPVRRPDLPRGQQSDACYRRCIIWPDILADNLPLSVAHPESNRGQTCHTSHSTHHGAYRYSLRQVDGKCGLAP
jgi:hypothetical protein